MDYAKMTLHQMHGALKSGETTAVQLLLRARGRIAALDKQGPSLNAVLELNPQAEGIAMQMDVQIKAGKMRGPLHGIPVLMKDNIDTADMLHTSAGSYALRNRYAKEDAHIVKLLREAGAVVLGKVNMTEFANLLAKDMPAGYSSRGGQVKSPFGEGHDPSGSSTGSAVCVAAGYVPVSIGTETFGSIISPAMACGIAAVKPTVGLLSRSGILPISISQDTAGPMARNVLDCALLLDVLAGEDASDPYTLHGQQMGGYAQAVMDAPKCLKGVKIGLCAATDMFGEEAVQKKAFVAALNAIKGLGAELVEVELPKLEREKTKHICICEIETCMNAALKNSLQPPFTLKDIAAYNIEHSETCLKFGQARFDEALLWDVDMNQPKYLEAREYVETTLKDSLHALFADAGISALITTWVSYFPVPGFPSVTIPVGFDGGMPVGLVLNGLAFSEKELLQIAAVIEKELGVNMAPPLPQ